ncbi:MAG: hypothetical protein QOK21_1810 [Solirubrobacteraceae bacterium]|nr:hypothetical protein [Solirubrobacteraceae bacterium]
MGWLAGGHRAEPSIAPSTAAAAPHHLRVGPLDVAVPAQWRLRISPPGSAAEAALGVAYAPSRDQASWNWLAGAPVDDPSLVPASVRKVLARPPRAPVPTHLAGRPAWAYRDLTLRDGGHLALVVSPVASGVLLSGCEVRRGVPPAGCGNGVLSIAGARAVPPTPDLALRLRGGPPLRALQRARAAGAGELRSATTGESQAAASTRLASAHRAAAATLAPFAPRTGPGAVLLGSLRASAAAYERLATAARAERPAAYRKARRQAGAADRRLRRALTVLARAR